MPLEAPVTTATWPGRGAGTAMPAGYSGGYSRVYRRVAEKVTKTSPKMRGGFQVRAENMMYSSYDSGPPEQHLPPLRDPRPRAVPGRSAQRRRGVRRDLRWAGDRLVRDPARPGR